MNGITETDKIRDNQRESTNPSPGGRGTTARLVPADRDGIGRGASVLRSGGVIALPTETTYGLSANVFDAAAVARAASLKGRDAHKPMPVLVRDREQAEMVVEEFTPAAERLAERFWPGALTIILQAKPDLVPGVVGPGGKVGIRVSSNPVCAAVLEALDFPITATSANPAGLPPATDAEGVLAVVSGEALELVLDGGPCPGGASTVVDLSGESPIVVREGNLPLEAIRRVLDQEPAAGTD